MREGKREHNDFTKDGGVGYATTISKAPLMG
jgi:hypothetical protein